MLIEPKSSDVSIVLLGSFNPAIINPDWLVLNEVIGKTQAEARGMRSSRHNFPNFAFQHTTTKSHRSGFK